VERTACGSPRRAAKPVGNDVDLRLEPRRETISTMVLVGLDPGGKNAFGWCVAENVSTLPLRIRAAGVADDVGSALRAIDEARAGTEIAAAGIDAPMFWTSSGDRRVDAYVRTTICDLGASSGTVGHVSSLRGTCLVQGMLAAMMLRERYPKLPVSEAHPKATLWMLREATRQRRASSVTSRDLAKYFETSQQEAATDHERDAALGALGAWAMAHHATKWRDIRGLDTDAITPLGEPVGYWVPMP
jgi:hypothetical protein